MKRPLLRIVPFCLLAVAMLFSGGCLVNKVVRVDDGALVPIDLFLNETKGSRVVFIGEYHDYLTHHMMQLKFIKALEKSGVDLVIGLEMFRSDSQNSLDRWVAGAMGKYDFIAEYKKNWNIAWYKYRGIFVFAKKHRIPIVGLSVPRGITHKVFTGKLDTLTPKEKRMAGDITCNVDKRYEELIKNSIGRHENMKATYENFCQVQMVWDNFMAKRIVDYLDAHPGKTMVVLSGSAHSWKRGVPRKMMEMSDIQTLVILPEMNDEFRRAEITTGDTDYLWINP